MFIEAQKSELLTRHKKRSLKRNSHLTGSQALCSVGTAHSGKFWRGGDGKFGFWWPASPIREFSFDASTDICRLVAQRLR